MELVDRDSDFGWDTKERSSQSARIISPLEVAHIAFCGVGAKNSRHRGCNLGAIPHERLENVREHRWTIAASCQRWMRGIQAEVTGDAIRRRGSRRMKDSCHRQLLEIMLRVEVGLIDRLSMGSTKVLETKHAMVLDTKHGC